MYVLNVSGLCTSPYRAVDNFLRFIFISFIEMETQKQIDSDDSSHIVEEKTVEHLNNHILDGLKDSLTEASEITVPDDSSTLATTSAPFHRWSRTIMQLSVLILILL